MATEEGADVKGIPQFWLQTLTYHPATRDYITAADAEALEALTDIRVEVSEDFTAFKIYFSFAENDYFSNTVILRHGFITLCFHQ